MVDLQKLTICVVDLGAGEHVVESLVKFFGKVIYCLPDTDDYKLTNRARVGTGIKGVERISNFWDYVNVNPVDREIDLFFFTDVGFSAEQQILKDLGYPVCGSGYADIMETDKWLFCQKLKKLGLPLAPSEKVNLSDLRDFLGKRNGKICHIKLRDQTARGVLQTFCCESLDEIEPIIDSIHSMVGMYKDEVELIVQEHIESELEIGMDTVSLDGEHPEWIALGIEDKDAGIVSKMFKGIPEIMAVSDRKLAPEYKKLGTNGYYTNECRITEDGEVYPIDETVRIPSPPGAMQPLLWGEEEFCRVIFSLAHGRLPDFKPANIYGAEIILTSEWYADNHWTMVSFPKEIANFVRLKNYCVKDDGSHWCVPNGNGRYLGPNGNGKYLGSVVAVGNSVDQVIKLVKERAKMVSAYRLSYRDDIFDTIKESISKAHKHGIPF